MFKVILYQELKTNMSRCYTIFKITVFHYSISAKMLSKQFSLKGVIPIRPKKGKRKRTNKPLTRGLFKIKGAKNFIGVFATLPDQTLERVGSACWDIQRHESKLFDLNESRIPIP